MRAGTGAPLERPGEVVGEHVLELDVTLARTLCEGTYSICGCVAEAGDANTLAEASDPLRNYDPRIGKTFG